MGLDVGRYSEAIVGGSAIEHWILISRTVSEHCTPQVWTLDCTFTCTPAITNYQQKRIEAHYYVYDYSASRMHSRLSKMYMAPVE